MRTETLRLRTNDYVALFALAFGMALMAAVKFVFDLSLVSVLVVYGVAFVGLTWKYPELVLMLIFAASPFQNDLSGEGWAKFSIAEMSLALAFPVFLVRCLLFRRRPVVGPILIPVLLYFAVCLSSSMVTWRGNTALISLIQMVVYLIVAVMVFASFTRRPEQLLLALNGLVVSGLFLCAVEIVIGSNYVMGLHKNGIGGALSCALVVATELWWAADSPRNKWRYGIALAILTAGLLFSLSRGAWLATLVGLLVLLGLRRKFRLFLQVCLIVIPLIALCWLFLPQESREYATNFSTEQYSARMRYQSLEFTQREFAKNWLTGVGVGLRKEYDATNVFWMTLAETGVLGLAAFLLIHIVFFSMVWKTQKRLSHNDPLFSLLIIGAALVLSQLVHGSLDHYWSRGQTMITWASAGMATSVYYATRRRNAALKERS
jgi:hypothetical protein